MALFSSILTLGRCGGGLYYATCHRFAVFDVFLAAWPLTSHAGMVRTTSKFDAISLNSTPAIRRRLNRLSPKFAGWLRFGYLPQRKISLRSDKILPPPNMRSCLLSVRSFTFWILTTRYLQKDCCADFDDQYVKRRRFAQRSAFGDPKCYILTLFSPKTEIFGRFSTRLGSKQDLT